MIFENIDQYIEHLDLFTRLKEAEKNLEEIQSENQRLTKENMALQKKAEQFNVFRIRQEEAKRKADIQTQINAQQMDQFNASLDEYTANMRSGNVSDLAKIRIRNFMMNFGNAPEFFKKFVEEKNWEYLDQILDHPARWSDEFRYRVEAALRKPIGKVLE